LKPVRASTVSRHNFRDALRRTDAPPDALQALGGWKQGKLVSDDCGDKSDPDYQIKYMQLIAFPGLDLGHLHRKGGVVVDSSVGPPTKGNSRNAA
jgi:hypothetical protein